MSTNDLLSCAGYQGTLIGPLCSTARALGRPFTTLQDTSPLTATGTHVFHHPFADS